MRAPFIIAAALLTVAGQAKAQANRTFVSGFGLDTNPCSLSAPCRSFAGALAQTNAGGEIAVLDTAGYGTLTITKSVSIVNEEGVEAGITASSGDAITINAGAFDVVNLRGLTLVGVGNNSGGNGITLNSAGSLNVQNCVIRGFGFAGLNLIPTGGANVSVSATIISDNGHEGILLKPSGAGNVVTAAFEQVQAIHNGADGFFVDGSSMAAGSIQATASNSLASGNNMVGFHAASNPGLVVTDFTVAHSTAIGGAIGVRSLSGAFMFLNSSTISGGGFGAGDNGIINSYGNNAITGGQQGALTPVSLR